jgi:5-methylcytosine-specific restriction endonuclease McrA
VFCADIHYGRRLIGPKGWVITCAICDQRTVVGHSKLKTCPGCRAEWQRRRITAWRKANPKKQREIERTHLRRRRARRKGVASEPIDRAGVFSRDGYRCQLCGGPTDALAMPPAYLAPVLDHIVPLCNGGMDTLENVQTAHFYCNSLKGDLSHEDFVGLYVFRPSSNLRIGL